MRKRDRQEEAGRGRKVGKERRGRSGGGEKASGFVGFVEYHLENMDCVF